MEIYEILNKIIFPLVCLELCYEVLYSVLWFFIRYCVCFFDFCYYMLVSCSWLQYYFVVVLLCYYLFCYFCWLFLFWAEFLLETTFSEVEVRCVYVFPRPHFAGLHWVCWCCFCIIVYVCFSMRMAYWVTSLGIYFIFPLLWVLGF